jgi:Polysaccharide lyase
VVRFDVYGTDSGDQYGGVRTDISKTPRDNCNGCDGWFAFGWYFPTDFVFPDTWFALLQNHGGSGNPPQSLELRTPPTGGTTRNYLYWKNQTQPSTGRTWFPLGPVQRGHWHYFLAQIKFRDDPTGEVRVWYSVDRLPDPTQAPTVEQMGINTLYSGYADKGRADLLLYRDYSSAAGQHQVAYACGYHRAGTAQLALTLPNCTG